MPLCALMGLKWEKLTLIVFAPAISAEVCVPGGVLWSISNQQIQMLVEYH